MDTLTLARDFASLLLDSAAKGTALLLLAAVAVWLCRRSSAALRHSIWCMSMGGLLLMPIASWALPAWQIPILPPESIPAPVPVAEFVRLLASSPVVETATLPPVELAPQFATEQPEMPSEQRLIEPVVITSPVFEPASIPAPAAPPLTTSEWMALLVTGGWLLGVTLFGVVLLAGMWRTVKLRRTSLMVTDGVWPGLMTELRQRLRLSRFVELREHALSVVPLTWGIWRPVVLLPRQARVWKESMQRAVLLHELAHVQRCDVACQVLGRLTCVLYWFHPLTWFALRQLRQEREQACDDAVVQSGEKASDYAEQLLEVARLCCAPRGLSLGVAMAEGSSLETRVKSLFDTARGHGPVSRRVAIASLLIGGAILGGLAPIEPTASQAETTANQSGPLNETPEADPTQEPAVPQKEPRPAGQNDKAPKVDDVNPHEKMIVLPDGHGDSKTIVTRDVEITLYLDKIVWSGEVIDGLEPGLWLTETEDPLNFGVPMDSLVKYRVVVRNTTDKEIEFLVRLLPFDGNDVPYLIPSSQLDPKGRIFAHQPAKEFRAQAQRAADRINRAYVITLAAGESALVPGEYGLYVGKKTDDINIPSISDFVPGTHWIVQPLLVHPLSDKERAELTRLLGEFKVTKIDRDGKTRQEPVVCVVAPDNSKGDFAYAKYQLEIGTLDASAHRNAGSAIWGEVEKGMQCGIRIMNPQPSYKTGDTLEAELLWRNTSEAVISTSRPRQLDLCPSIEDAEGEHLEIDFGARYDLLPGGHDFQPGEVRSLGVAKITLVAQGTPGPKDNKKPGHIRLEPGKYKLSASGGVGNISPRSGKYEFTVVDSKPVPPAPDTADSSSAMPDPKVAPTLIRGSNYVVIPYQTTELQHELGNSADDVNAPRVYVRVDGTGLEESDGQLKLKSIDWDRLRLDMKPYANSRRGIVNFHIVNPGLTDESRRQLEWTLKGFGEQHGGFAKAYWTMTFGGNSTKFWEEIDSVQKESERRGGSAESGTGNEIAKAYPVRTFLSCLTHRSADCVVLVAPRLTADTRDALPDDIRSSIAQAVKQLTLPQKELIHFHIHFEPAARKTVEWLYREGAKQLARDLGFENGAVSSAEYSPQAVQNSLNGQVETAPKGVAPKQSPNTIIGQIVNDKKEGIARADVALVAFEIVRGQLERQGHVIATTIADPLGNYSLKLPAEEADRKKFGAVWARAEGHVAARSNWSTVIADLPERKAVLTLAATEGTSVRVLDSTGKPLPGARLVPVLVGVPHGVGYPLPKEWEEQSTGTSDVEGKAHLPHVDAEAMKGLDIVPPGEMGILRYGQNHFLNIRPMKEGDHHFEFKMPETGSVTGQLVVSPGSTLPKDLTITLESYIKPHSLSQAVITVPVDADGTFHVDKLAAGWLFVPEFLPAHQPLRADVAGQIEVKANEELQLRIPLAPGIKIHGQVRKSDTQEGVPNYSVSVIYGQAVSNLNPGFAWLKYEVPTDGNGQFECLVPPGPINVNTSSYVDGYSSAYSWLPKEKRGHWGGMRFVVPAEESFDLGILELTRKVDIQGQVVNLKNEPLIDWSVYGYPNIPGFTQSGTMNSMAGVHTDKEGNFSGSYRQTYPPAFWKVSQRVWKTKYEFDDHKYAATVISRRPLVLQVDTTKELSGDGDENIPIDPEAPVSPVTLAAPTKRETTQFAPNIPQTRPKLRGAPTPAEPRPEVDMKRELLQRLVRGGKISSDSLNAMITLVSSEGAYDWDFISVILYKFDESCEPKSTSSKRNLLAVLTKILEIHGSSRWHEPESGPDSKPQAVIPDTESLSRLTSEILEHLIDQGGTADRSDIDAFVMALRQAHHTDGTEFLRLVLQNPEVNAPANQKPGLWADNMGGTWRDAKFHAAVALAELGESEGVERLIEFARPNGFGLDESLFSLAHTRDASGSRRASSLFALIDLFGLEPDASFAQIETWWKVNQGQFHPKKVALGRAIPARTAEQPQQ